MYLICCLFCVDKIVPRQLQQQQKSTWNCFEIQMLLRCFSEGRSCWAGSATLKSHWPCSGLPHRCCDYEIDRQWGRSDAGHCVLEAPFGQNHSNNTCHFYSIGCWRRGNGLRYLLRSKPHGIQWFLIPLSVYIELLSWWVSGRSEVWTGVSWCVGQS